jgi:type I restriction enzyme S subunit
LLEQSRILDLINSVDAFIEAVSKQLDSARESRNALLHDLLTSRGNGWVDTQIGSVANVLSGFAFRSEFFNTAQGMPLIRIRDLPRKGSTEAYYSGSYEDRYLVTKGDFLIGMDGEFHCYEWNGPPALLNQRVCRIQDFNRDLVEPRFIYLAVNKYLGEIEMNTGYTTVKHISSRQILAISIPLPPLHEQARIVEIISSMDEFINGIELTLEESRKLRSAFLSDLLSGKHEIPKSYDKIMDGAQ